MNSDLVTFTFKPQIQIPDDIDVVWVADMFVEDYVGGAELTSDALIKSSNFKVFKLHSKDVTMKLLEQGVNAYWIFSNFAQIDMSLIPSIVANLRYSIVEYDYKYCRYRSPDKHEANEQSPCDCHQKDHGKLISAFYHGARALWWMSEGQRNHYFEKFPTLVDKPSTVLSSVFDDETFATINVLSEKRKDDQRSGWIVLGSPSWVKGQENAEEYCRENGLEYEVLWGLEYHEVLDKLSRAEGFVYLPNGADTCPRMVIEAKLLGCKLVLNENVQHKDEEWFAIDDLETTKSYLYLSRERFWNGTFSDMGELDATLSGYTTTYNCIDSDYPYVESIMSMLGFCDEVVVVDAGSDDGTWESLQQLAETYSTLKIHQQRRDRSKKRWAIDFDGRLKALARSLCTKAFCWQQDSDEVVHEGDYDKVKKLCKHFPRGVNLLALPVVEYWGSTSKVRCDVNNWKWRLSRNAPGITHGVPAHLRRYDDDGELYAAKGTDSCDYVWLSNYQPVPFLNFVTDDVNNVKKAAMAGDMNALNQYQGWLNEVIQNVPCVHHYSWYNIERKITSYRDGYWKEFWASMYDEDVSDTAENNMFFDKPWSDVTDDDIEELAGFLQENVGGWIFHRKLDRNAKVPHVELDVEHPTLMDSWLDLNTCEYEDEDALEHSQDA